MAKTGRKAHIDPPERWNIFIPASLAVQVTLMLYDPAKAKVGYASRSKYVEQLIRNDLQKRKEQA